LAETSKTDIAETGDLLYFVHVTQSATTTEWQILTRIISEKPNCKSAVVIFRFLRFCWWKVLGF